MSYTASIGPYSQKFQSGQMTRTYLKIGSRLKIRHGWESEYRKIPETTGFPPPRE